MQYLEASSAVEAHYKQDMSPEARFSLGLSLPSHIQQRMARALDEQLMGVAGASSGTGRAGSIALGSSATAVAVASASRRRVVVEEGEAFRSPSWQPLQAIHSKRPNEVPFASSLSSLLVPPSLPFSAATPMMPSPLRNALSARGHAALATLRFQISDASVAAASAESATAPVRGVSRIRGALPFAWSPSPSLAAKARQLSPIKYLRQRLREITSRSTRLGEFAERARSILYDIRSQNRQWSISRSDRRAAWATAAKHSFLLRRGAVGSVVGSRLGGQAAPIAMGLASPAPLHTPLDAEILKFWDRFLRLVQQQQEQQQGQLHAIEYFRPSVAGERAPSHGGGLMAARAVSPHDSLAELQFSHPKDVGTAVKRLLRPSIAHIVGVHARSQSLKGLLTAGPAKAALYGWKKLEKYAAVMVQRLFGR